MILPIGTAAVRQATSHPPLGGADVYVVRSHRVPLCTLLRSFAQSSFESDVKIASHLRHALIPVLAKEGRGFVILKNALTLLVLKQNHPERRVESRGKLIAGHF